MAGLQSIVSALRNIQSASIEDSTLLQIESEFVEMAGGYSEEDRKKLVAFFDRIFPILTNIRNGLAADGRMQEEKTEVTDIRNGLAADGGMQEEKTEVRVVFECRSNHWTWDGLVVTVDDFKRAFRTGCVQVPDQVPLIFGAVGPKGEFGLKLEHNFDISRLEKAAVGECYLVFESPADAALVLGLSGLKLSCKLPGNSRSLVVGVGFAAPRHDPKTRETGRVIGGLLARIKEIETELLGLGFVPDNYGNYALSSNLVDSDCLTEWVVRFKRERQAGMPRDGMDAKKLKYYNPVPAAELTAKKDQLLVEMDDAWIKLRELQLAGYEFRC